MSVCTGLYAEYSKFLEEGGRINIFCKLTYLSGHVSNALTFNPSPYPLADIIEFFLFIIYIDMRAYHSETGSTTMS